MQYPEVSPTRKNEIVDHVLETMAPQVVRGLANLGDYAKLEFIPPMTPTHKVLETILNKKMPVSEYSRGELFSLYTTPEIFRILEPMAEAGKRFENGLAVKKLVNLLYYGLVDDKYFGISFFDPVFLEHAKKLPKFEYTDDLLKDLRITRTGPSYLLKYKL